MHRLRHGHAHEGRKTPEYNAWRNMKIRCYDENHDSFEYYGGRGIQVCDRWLDDFAHFLADMGLRPDGCSLDRIDPDGNYEPSNCRWATVGEQARNKRSARVFSYKGRTQCIFEWAEEYGVNYHTLYKRLNRLGMTIDEALEKPIREYRREAA